MYITLTFSLRDVRGFYKALSVHCTGNGKDGLAGPSLFVWELSMKLLYAQVLLAETDDPFPGLVPEDPVVPYEP